MKKLGTVLLSMILLFSVAACTGVESYDFSGQGSLSPGTGGNPQEETAEQTAEQTVERVETVFGERFYEIDDHNFIKVTGKPNFTIDPSVPEDTARETIKLSRLISDGMVLQRNAVGCVFGQTSYESGCIAVRFNGDTVYGVVANYEFKVYLPIYNEGGPYEMVIFGETHKITVKNVLIGEVFFFGGQSNMEWRIKDTLSYGKQYLKLGDYKPTLADDPDTFPLYDNTNTQYSAQVEVLKNEYRGAVMSTLENNDNIRIFDIRNAYSDNQSAASPGLRFVTNTEPLKDVPKSVSWQAAAFKKTGAYSGSGSIYDVSAFAYYFAKEFYKNTKLPVGVISGNFGGTPVMCWVPKNVYEHYNSNKLAQEDKLFQYGVGDQDQVSSAYRGFNTFVAPVLNYKMRSVVWAQGEGQYNKYADAMIVLINTWRDLADNAKLGFMITEHHRCGDQTSVYIDDQTVEEYRSGEPDKGILTVPYYLGRIEQQKIADSLEYCEVSAAINTGDYDDCHDSDKSLVARQSVSRFMEVFLARSGVLSGPVADTAVLSEDQRTITITFTNTGGGLKLENDGINFMVKTADGKYYEARAQKAGGAALTVDVSGLTGKTIAQVIYGALDYPRISRLDMKRHVSVYNAEGYPSAQFVLDV
ncbi:MAG: hypothetical protein LBH24_05910 [Clostridiales bacterium]|nr:hypothetical protein [Clostridiales bacterium]